MTFCKTVTTHLQCCSFCSLDCLQLLSEVKYLSLFSFTLAKLEASYTLRVKFTVVEQQFKHSYCATTITSYNQRYCCCSHLIQFMSKKKINGIIMVVRANYDTFGCGQTFCKLPLEVRRLSVHYKKKHREQVERQQGLGPTICHNNPSIYCSNTSCLQFLCVIEVL